MTNSNPIWHSPAWITAMVGLVGAFLTIPQVVGDYFEKNQDIELAKEKTEAARIGNVESKQDQEFSIVNNTLAKQGTERVFLLRYLAATLDDPDAKEWAKMEVQRLDDLATLQEELEKSRLELEQKEQDIQAAIAAADEDYSNLKIEIVELRSQLRVKNAEIIEQQLMAGLSSEDRGDYGRQLVSIQITRDPGVQSNQDSIWIDGGSWGIRCDFYDSNVCDILDYNIPPQVIALESTYGNDHNLFGELFVSSYPPTYHDFYEGKSIPYDCVKETERVVCTKS
ncbi:MAG: hypothetical protein OXN90_19630 [Gemmatimonadota bacterium]|nr:hypothetical protein [Gemmatimonadota bacterium]